MKLFNGVITSFALMALGSGFAMAEHGDGETGIARLRSEAQSLNQVVYYSYINPRVKSEVRQFTQAVESLNFCETRGGRGGRGFVPNSEGMVPMDHGDNPRDCFLEIQRVQYTWETVDRRLYDTRYDFPQIYFQYLETSEAYYGFLREEGVNP